MEFNLDHIIKDFLKYNQSEGYDNNLNVFKEFLLAKSDNNHLTKEFLQSIRTETIIESLDFYVKERKLTSVETALRYVSCIKEFFSYNFHVDALENKELAIEIGYPAYSEKSFRHKVNKTIAEDKRLVESKEFVALREGDIKLLINECDITLSSEKILRNFSKKKKYYNKFRSALILKLIIFSGIRYEVLHALERGSLDLNYNTITINDFRIHLPRNLKDQFELYDNLLCQINGEMKDRKYLFLESDLSKISSKTYTTSFFLKTLTGRGDLYGVIKYTIIEMIKKGVNSSLIKQFTGIGDDIFDECQNFVNEYSASKTNRYLDSKIISLDLFDLL